MKMPIGLERLHTVETLIKEDFELIMKSITLLKEMAEGIQDCYDNGEGTTGKAWDALQKFKEWK
jgi:hypothetical protein